MLKITLHNYFEHDKELILQREDYQFAWQNALLGSDPQTGMTDTLSICLTSRVVDNKDTFFGNPDCPEMLKGLADLGVIRNLHEPVKQNMGEYQRYLITPEYYDAIDDDHKLYELNDQKEVKFIKKVKSDEL